MIYFFIWFQRTKVMIKSNIGNYCPPRILSKGRLEAIPCLVTAQNIPRICAIDRLPNTLDGYWEPSEESVLHNP
jgi:hypothetical protein